MNWHVSYVDALQRLDETWHPFLGKVYDVVKGFPLAMVRSIRESDDALFVEVDGAGKWNSVLRDVLPEITGEMELPKLVVWAFSTPM